MSDQDGWLTKAEAAARLGVDARTIERRARQGQLGARARPGFPTWYNPVDVERLAQARPTGVRAVILGAAPTSPPNGHGAIAHPRSGTSPIEGLLVQVLEAILGALPQGPTGPTAGPTPEKVFLSLPEAATYSGLSQTCLRKLIADGTLKAVKDRGWRIRRTDLEAV